MQYTTLLVCLSRTRSSQFCNNTTRCQSQTVTTVTFDTSKLLTTDIYIHDLPHDKTVKTTSTSCSLYGGQTPTAVITLCATHASASRDTPIEKVTKQVNCDTLERL